MRLMSGYAERTNEGNIKYYNIIIKTCMGLIDVDCVYGLTIAPVIERG